MIIKSLIDRCNMTMNERRKKKERERDARISGEIARGSTQGRMGWGKKRVLSALCSQNICLNELVARSLKTPLDENRRDNWPFLRKRVTLVRQKFLKRE